MRYTASLIEIAMNPLEITGRYYGYDEWIS